MFASTANQIAVWALLSAKSVASRRQAGSARKLVMGSPWHRRRVSTSGGPTQRGGGDPQPDRLRGARRPGALVGTGVVRLGGEVSEPASLVVPARSFAPANCGWVWEVAEPASLVVPARSFAPANCGWVWEVAEPTSRAQRHEQTPRALHVRRCARYPCGTSGAHSARAALSTLCTLS